jgi:hypothetical protein
MSKPDHELITELKAVLTSQHYSPVVIRKYCAYAREFLDCLARREILVADVTEAQVERYLCHAIALFRKRPLERVSVPVTATHPPPWKRDASLLAWLDSL